MEVIEIDSKAMGWDFNGRLLPEKKNLSVVNLDPQVVEETRRQINMLTWLVAAGNWPSGLKEGVLCDVTADRSTARTSRVLLTLLACMYELGSPKLRFDQNQLAHRAGLSDPGCVRDALKKLEGFGFLTYKPGRADVYSSDLPHEPIIAEASEACLTFDLDCPLWELWHLPMPTLDIFHRAGMTKAWWILVRVSPRVIGRNNYLTNTKELVQLTGMTSRRVREGIRLLVELELCRRQGNKLTFEETAVRSTFLGGSFGEVMIKEKLSKDVSNNERLTSYRNAFGEKEFEKNDATCNSQDLLPLD